MSVPSDSVETFDLAFLYALASNPQRILSVQEEDCRQRARQQLLQADTIVFELGGKAGRLGECVVATGLLEGCLQALHQLGRDGTRVLIQVPGSLLALFPQQTYRDAYWPDIHVVTQDALSPVPALPPVINGQHILTLDLHGGHDGPPYMQIQTTPQMTSARIAQLFRVGIRDYAQRGVQQRYADCIRDLFVLPAGIPEALRAQPRLYRIPEDDVRYHELANRYELQDQSPLIVCSFQSVVLAKCYELWDEVIAQISQSYAQDCPGRQLTFFVACGPDEDQPPGFKEADIAEWLEEITSSTNNTRVLVAQTTSLRNLVALLQHASLALANDTGPCHIAGALHIPTIVPYLPGTIYSQTVWASTSYHHGVTLHPNPYNNQQLVNAVTWGKTEIINHISPQALAQQALTILRTRCTHE